MGTKTSYRGANAHKFMLSWDNEQHLEDDPSDFIKLFVTVDERGSTISYLKARAVKTVSGSWFSPSKEGQGHIFWRVDGYRVARLWRNSVCGSLDNGLTINREHHSQLFRQLPTAIVTKRRGKKKEMRRGVLFHKDKVTAQTSSVAMTTVRDCDFWNHQFQTVFTGSPLWINSPSEFWRKVRGGGGEGGGRVLLSQRFDNDDGVKMEKVEFSGGYTENNRWDLFITSLSCRGRELWEHLPYLFRRKMLIPVNSDLVSGSLSIGWYMGFDK